MTTNAIGFAESKGLSELKIALLLGDCQANLAGLILPDYMPTEVGAHRVLAPPRPPVL